jgi:hypothetical protein
MITFNAEIRFSFIVIIIRVLIESLLWDSQKER